jgi:uncharacterized membrane protein
MSWGIYAGVWALLVGGAISWVFTMSWRKGVSTTESFGSVGAALWGTAMVLLPINDKYNPDGPLGGFSFLALGVQFAGYFITLVTLLLLYTQVDFFGSGIVLFFLIVIALTPVLRRLRSLTLTRDEYFAIPLQNIETIRSS